MSRVLHATYIHTFYKSRPVIALTKTEPVVSVYMQYVGILTDGLFLLLGQIVTAPSLLLSLSNSHLHQSYCPH